MEIRAIYEVITSVWQIAKKFGVGPLSDEQWQAFIDTVNGAGAAITNKRLQALFTGMCLALSDFYEGK